MDKAWQKMQLCWDMNEDGCGSWRAETLGDSVHSRAGEAVFDPGISFSSPRQEGRSEMIPA